MKCNNIKFKRTHPEPGLIPLNTLGIIDAVSSEISDKQLLSLAMANLSQDELNSGQAVKHSSDFVNEYPRKDDKDTEYAGTFEDPNIWLVSFPTLSPYGEGGIESSQPQKLSMSLHVQWALQYHDKWFQNHLHFMFQAFGVLQKRQVASSTGLQICQRDFMNHEEEIQALKPSDFLNAAKEEVRSIPFTNSAIRDLCKHVYTIRTKVMGTDESRIKIRGQIWSTTAI